MLRTTKAGLLVYAQDELQNKSAESSGIFYFNLTTCPNVLERAGHCGYCGLFLSYPVYSLDELKAMICLKLVDGSSFPAFRRERGLMWRRWESTRLVLSRSLPFSRISPILTPSFWGTSGLFLSD